VRTGALAIEKQTDTGQCARHRDARRFPVCCPLLRDLDEGPLIQIYRCPPRWTVDNGFLACPKPFPPIVAGIGAATKSSRWTIVGNVTLDCIEVPKFLASNARKGIRQATWWLKENGKDEKIGLVVPEHLQGLEVLVVWSAELIEERLETGVNPFSYERMVGWMAAD